MSDSDWTDALAALRPCKEAVDWCRTHPDLATAWGACARPDWLFWLLGRTGASRQLLVLAACDCAAEALVHVPAGEDRPRLAIETARRWARGEATIEEVRRAQQGATAYAYAYAADAAAAYAAYAAYSARASRRRSCELIRVHFPTAPSLTRGAP